MSAVVPKKWTAVTVQLKTVNFLFAGASTVPSWAAPSCRVPRSQRRGRSAVARTAASSDRRPASDSATASATTTAASSAPAADATTAAATAASAHGRLKNFWVSLRCQEFFYNTRKNWISVLGAFLKYFSESTFFRREIFGLRTGVLSSDDFILANRLFWCRFVPIDSIFVATSISCK